MGNEEAQNLRDLAVAIEEAIASYTRDKRPVVILDEAGEVLHGREIHRWSLEHNLPVDDVLTISGVNRAAFERSNAAALLEAARQEFLTGHPERIQ